MLILGFTNIFSDLGVSVALFSRQHISKREYSSLYWVGVLTGICLYLLLVAVTPLAATFYQLPQLAALIPLIALDLIISVAGRQFYIFRQKALEFKTLALIDIAAAFVSFVVAVMLAYKGLGVYSLVYSALAASLVKALTLIFSGIRAHPIGFYIDLKSNKKFYKIGLYQTGAQVLDYIASQIDIFIIGKLMSVSDLGVYNLIKQLVLRPYGLINSVITRVSVPLLASINEQVTRLRNKYLEMIRLVGFINIPLYTLIALFSKEIVSVIYGPDYADAAVYLQILCLWGVSAAIINAASAVIAVRGRTDLGFIWTIVRVLTNPLFIVVGSFFGLTGIVWANSVCALLYVLLYHRLLVVKIFKEIDFRTYFFSFLDLLGLCSMLFLILFLIKETYLFNISIWIKLPVLFLVFVYIYARLNRKLFTFIKSFLVGNRN